MTKIFLTQETGNKQVYYVHSSLFCRAIKTNEDDCFKLVLLLLYATGTPEQVFTENSDDETAVRKKNKIFKKLF